MYFKLQQNANVLKVEDDFAHLADVQLNGDLEFEFTYTVSQREVVERKAQRVLITVDGRNVSPKSLLGSTQRGRVDTEAIVLNVRTAVIDAKSVLTQRERYRVAELSSDVTAYIDNDAIGKLRARVPISDIPSFNRPRLKLVPASDPKNNNDPQPILQRVGNTAAVGDLKQTMQDSSVVDQRSLMHDMVTRQGLDPSYVFELTSRSVSEVASRGGLSVTQRASEKQTDPASQLLNSFLFPSATPSPPKTTQDIGDNDLVQTLQTVTDDTVDVTETVVVPASRLKLDGRDVTQLYVTFALIDASSNTSIHSVTKTLDVTKHVNLFYTPKLSPVVKVVVSETSTRANLEIKQVDPSATDIQLYKKSFWIASAEIDDYTLIGTYKLTNKNQSLLIPVDLPVASTAIYRAIPSGKQSIQGFEYTNAVLNPAKFVPPKAVALTAHQVDTGVQLEVRKIPLSVVAIQFLVWNLTRFDDEPTIVNSDAYLVDTPARRADLVAAIDSSVDVNNVYRYVARLIYLNGDVEDFGDATIEFIKPSPGEVDTRITGLTVTHNGSPNVVFTVTTLVNDADLDVVKKLLERQGLASFFQGDMQAQRDQFQKLIAHNVYRVNLNTGLREDFGILTSEQFDDAALRKKRAVEPLKYGHRYRYEVYPLMRSPETLFDSLQKDAIDLITKKPYSFYPAKFLHPMTLQRGVIVSTAGARQRYAKDPMSFGIVGSIVQVEVSFDDDSAKVIEPSATRFDRRLNIVSWRVLGDINQVDHFLIMKQVHGINTLVGKAHSEFAYGSCQYVHQVSSHDQGALRYVIVPVMNDYRVGQAATTNTIIVEVA